MTILNELRKLFKVKVVLIIFVLYMGSFLLAEIPNIKLNQKDFEDYFIENHGAGPYSPDLLEAYKNLHLEIRACESWNDDFTVKTFDEVNCESLVSDKTKSLKSLYPSYTYEELYHKASFVFRVENMAYNIKSIEYQINKQRLDENKSAIEAFFFNKMTVYHSINPAIKRIENGEFYVSDSVSLYDINNSLIIGSVTAIVMVVLSIATVYSNDSQSRVDGLILTSKKGRKIVNAKLISVMLYTIIYTLICTLPIILMKVLVLRWDLSAKIVELLWYDLTGLELIIYSFGMALFANIVIALCAAIVTMYSRKLINSIVYNAILYGSIIGLIQVPLPPLFRIILYHTPFGYIYYNVNLFTYSYDYKGSYDQMPSYMSYREYPLIFILLNLVIMVVLHTIFRKNYLKRDLY